MKCFVNGSPLFRTILFCKFSVRERYVSVLFLSWCWNLWYKWNKNKVTTLTSLSLICPLVTKINKLQLPVTCICEKLWENWYEGSGHCQKKKKIRHLHFRVMYVFFAMLATCTCTFIPVSAKKGIYWWNIYI